MPPFRVYIVSFTNINLCCPMFFMLKNMLSALLELLPSIPTEQDSSKREAYIALLVSAYPDVQPWFVKASFDSSDLSDDNFYLKYLSALLHYEEGNDAAKQDGNLIRVSLLL